MWKQLLDELNAAALANIERKRLEPCEHLGLEPFINGFPDSPLAQLAARIGKEHVGWLGQPGASLEQIREAEQRLGVILPASYREFLLESNGFLVPGTYCCVLLPIELVRRFSDDNYPIVAMWNDLHEADPYLEEADFTAHIGEALQISACPSDFDWFALIDTVNTSPEGELWTIMYSRQGYEASSTFTELIQELVCNYR